MAFREVTDIQLDAPQEQTATPKFREVQDIQLDAPEQSQPDFNSPEALAQRQQELKRTAGLTTRSVLQAVATPITILPSLAAAGINAATGSNITPLSEVVSSGLTAIGLPEPKTAGERITGDIIEGAAGGGFIAKGLQRLGTAAPKIIQKMAANPLVESVAGGTAAGASSVAREAGANPITQIGLGVVGGISGGSGASALQRIGTSRAGESAKILSDVAERGIDETSSFSNLRTGLQQEADKQNIEISNLFTQAKERGKNTFVDKSGLSELSADIKMQAKSEVGVAPAGLLKDTAKKLDTLLSGDEGLNAQGVIQPRRVSLNEIETLRRSLTGIAKGGGAEGNVAGRLVGRIDSYLDNTIDKATGDKEAINIWKSAITARREFGNKFENPKEIAKALTDSSNEAVEQIFIGSGGAALNKELSKNYDNTLNALPVEQQQQAGFLLKQSIVNRMIKNAAQSADDGEGVSASRLSNQIRNFRRDNQSMWAKFSPEEQGVLTGLESDLRDKSKGGVLNVVGKAAFRFLSRASYSHLELPRTLKPKTIVSVDELLELTKIKPEGFKLPVTGAVVGTKAGTSE